MTEWLIMFIRDNNLAEIDEIEERLRALKLKFKPTHGDIERAVKLLLLERGWQDGEG